MKRPLFLVCITCAVIMAFIGNAGDSFSNLPAFYGETILLEESEQNETIMLKGCVASCDTVSEGKCLSISHLTVQSKNRSELFLLSELKLNVTIKRTDIEPGDQLVFSGIFIPYQGARNPGGFDAHTYYHTDHFIGTLKNPVIHTVKKGTVSLPRILYAVREKLRISSEAILGEKKGRILAAICLGEKRNMKTEWKETYQEAGISHILAISGLHITMIGMTVFRILRRIFVPYAGAAVLSGVFCLLYVMMTGFGISSLRALLMFFLWLGAQVCGRKYDRITAVAIAALFLICSESSCVRTASFWLSFSAVGVIAVFLPAVQNSCQFKWKSVNALLGSGCIFFGTLPVTLSFFYLAAPWSILTNLPVVTCMPVLMGMGFLASFSGLFLKSAGIFFGASVSMLLDFFELLCKIQIKLPGSVWIAGKPESANMVLYYMLLVMAAITAKKWNTNVKDAKKKWQIRILWLGVFTLCTALMHQEPDRSMRITCLDVGQGDCSLLQFPDGTSCMIDGGSSSEKKIWKYQISSAVEYYGVDTLDYVFLSHADSDHTNGIQEFLREYETGIDGRNVHGITMKCLVLPPSADPSDFVELKQLAAKNGIHILSMEQEDWIQGTNWKLTCLAPEVLELTGEKNEDSMVLMLQYERFRMLFTGDLEGKSEKKLVRDLTGQGKMLDADVLKVGHHGSKDASSEEFLKAVSPAAAVISCGKDNSYGHPAKETVLRLKEAGAYVLETAVCNAVEIVTDGTTFFCHGYKG